MGWNYLGIFFVLSLLVCCAALSSMCISCPSATAFLSL